MVKKVLAWRSADPSGSKTLWDELQGANMHLGQLLASSSPTSPKSLQNLKTAFSDIRKRIREMGTLSCVPIEPPEQTELLDALTEVDGVVGGVVPGAGGYDAVVLLVQDDARTRSKIDAFLTTWSAAKKQNVRLLQTQGELEGARVEDGDYGEWAC